MKPARPRVTLAAAVCLLASAAPASAAVRVWTDDLNRTWQGEFLRVDGLSAVFLVSGKEYLFPTAHLSAADKLVIFKLRQAPTPAATPIPPPPAPPNETAATPAGSAAAAPAAPGKAGSFGSVALEPGSTVETELPLTESTSRDITKWYGSPAPATHILASLAVPPGFDPDKPQRVLVVSVSADGQDGSIPLAKGAYTKQALAHGWVVLAADGADGKPKKGGDNIIFRLDLLKVALAELNARFPKAKTDWTFATGGFSGGCGYASHQALWLSTQGYHVGGMLLHNGGYTPNEWEHQPEMVGNTSHWHQIPMFVSYGEKDTIAKVPMVLESVNTIKHGGYVKVRAEPQPTGHAPWGPHVDLALDWFDSFLKHSG